MPSGAKKRKAAKKKKEKESSSNASNQPVHSHGEDDLKHQDDKEMDGGDVSSPASQDHHSHHQHFTEEEEVEKGEDTSNMVFIEGVRNEGIEEQKGLAEEGNVVQVEKELKYKGDSEKNDVLIDYDELQEKSYDGGVSGSSSSSSRSNSDDESHGLKQNEHTTHNTVFESELKENEENLKSAQENVGFSAAGMDTISNEAVEAIVQSPDNTIATSDAKEEHVVRDIDEKLALSYSAPRDDDNNGAQHEKDSEFPKPVVAPTLPPVQTTSWKSCCGLFELLQGSGR